MKNWKENELIEQGYDIWNAKITNANLSMSGHGCFTLELTLEGDGCGVVYGGYCLGKGYLGADESFFSASGAGMIYIMRIMDTIGVEKFNDLKGQYVRVASMGNNESVKILGNIIKDKWFDSHSFFIKDDKEVRHEY